MRNLQVGTGVTKRRWVFGILAAAVLAAPLAAQTTATAPAPAPAAAPAVSNEPPKTLAEICRFSDAEFALVHEARDGAPAWIETPLFVLLRRASWLPTDGGAFTNALKPAIDKFWSEPKSLCGNLVTIEALVADTKPNSQTSDYNEWWPKKEFYWVYLVAPGGRVVMVALPEKPTLGGKGSKVRVSGFFYKTVELEAGNHVMQVYPVIVARTIEPIGGAVGSSPWSLASSLYAVGAVLLLLLAAYFHLWSKARRRRQMMRERVSALTHAPVETEEEDDYAIDPQLQQEVERFEAEQESARTHTPIATEPAPGKENPPAEKK